MEQMIPNAVGISISSASNVLLPTLAACGASASPNSPSSRLLTLNPMKKPNIARTKNSAAIANLILSYTSVIGFSFKTTE